MTVAEIRHVEGWHCREETIYRWIKQPSSNVKTEALEKAEREAWNSTCPECVRNVRLARELYIDPSLRVIF